MLDGVDGAELVLGHVHIAIGKVLSRWASQSDRGLVMWMPLTVMAGERPVFVQEVLACQVLGADRSPPETIIGRQGPLTVRATFKGLRGGCAPSTLSEYLASPCK